MGSVKLLLEKEEGGAAWLQGLRQVPYQQASEALCTLPGVGPKVRQALSIKNPVPNGTGIERLLLSVRVGAHMGLYGSFNGIPT